jgi:prefoldin subunit 5
MNLDFLLADTIWAKGKINKGTQKVNLWLGANVLVEYSFDEAKTLLKKNLDNASINLKTFVRNHLELKNFFDF